MQVPRSNFILFLKKSIPIFFFFFIFGHLKLIFGNTSSVYSFDEINYDLVLSHQICCLIVLVQVGIPLFLSLFSLG